MLTKQEYKILIVIKKRRKLSASDIAKIVKEDANIICNRLLPIKKNRLVEIDLNDDYEEMYTLTNIGRQSISDYESKQKDNLLSKAEDRFWKFAPIAISIISLLKSYDII